MDWNPESSGDSVLETETHLQVESSTLAALGPRSLTPSLDLLMILVPVVNDAAAQIANFLHAVETQVEPPFGVMFVYDRDDATTLAVASEFAKTRPWLDLIHNAAGRDAISALRGGFRAIGQGPVAVMSIDGSDNPDTLSRMRRLYAEGHRIVSAARDLRGGKRQGSGRVSLACGRLANRLIRTWGKLPLEDATSRFRIYDAALVNSLEIDSDHEADIPVELAAKARARGVSIVEVPTTWTDGGRHGGPFASLTGIIRWLQWCRHAAPPSDDVPPIPEVKSVITPKDARAADSRAPRDGR